MGSMSDSFRARVLGERDGGGRDVDHGLLRGVVELVPRFVSGGGDRLAELRGRVVGELDAGTARSHAEGDAEAADLLRGDDLDVVGGLDALVRFAGGLP